MKHLFILLLIAFPQMLFGQKVFDQHDFTNFIHNEIFDLNREMNKAVMTDKLAAYSSDSLSNRTTSGKIEDLLSFFNMNGTKVFVPTGLAFSFKQTWDVGSATTNYILEAIAPLITYEMLGIKNPAYWIKLEDLNAVLPAEDVLFLKALAMQAASLGRYSPYLDENPTTLNKADFISYNTVMKTPNSAEVDEQMDTVLGNHNHALIGALFIQYSLPGQIRVFKDPELKNEFTRGVTDILQMNTTMAVVQVQDPDFPDDPFALKDTMVLVAPELMFHYDMVASKSGDAVIIGVQFPKALEASYTTGYISLKAINDLLEPFDAVVLERFWHKAEF